MDKYFSLLFDRKINEAEDLRKKCIPKKLIKFFSLGANEEQNEKKFSSLEGQKLWFSSVDQLNDPYEYQGLYVNEEELVKAYYPKEIIDTFKALWGGEELKKYALVSLSGNSFDCLPMWAYYANNHRGYCVEYEVLNPTDIYKVSYESNRIAATSIAANSFLQLRDMCEDGETTNQEIAFYRKLFKQQLFIKHESWKHEKEYRITCQCSEKSGCLVPIEIVGLKTSKIVAGLNCKKSHMDRLKEIAAKISCDVSQTQISENNYSLLKKI